MPISNTLRYAAIGLVAAPALLSAQGRKPVTDEAAVMANARTLPAASCSLVSGTMSNITCT